MRSRQPEAAVSAQPPVTQGIQQARGGGRAVPDAIRVRMERVTGADLGDVRIHADARADELNDAVEARAFTAGADVFVRRSEYRPGTPQGDALLAHELVHTVQQRTLRTLSLVQRTKITVGFARNKETIWDTDWSESERNEKLRTMKPSDRVTLLDKMGSLLKRGPDADLSRDLEKVLRDTLSGLNAWQRSELHKLRRTLVEFEREAEAEQVVGALRSAITPVSTGGVLPQKKTPSGGTQVINMNYVLASGGSRNDTEYQHARFFANSARKLDLRLHILTTKAGKDDLEKDKLLDGVQLEWTIVERGGDLSKWAEDSVEFLQSGQVAILEQFNDSALRQGMVEGRRERWRGLHSAGFEEAPFGAHTSKDWVPEGILVNAGKTGAAREKALTELGHAPAHLRFYAEGGNLIVGEDAKDETVVLVGRDAIAATRAEYAFLDDGQVRTLIAEDLGIKPEQVIAVEQPGKFHLDMGLLFVGKGWVIVNDSTAVREQAEAELLKSQGQAGLKEIVAKLTLQCGLEDRAAADLKEAGMQVIRKKLEHKSDYNFFNGEFVMDAGGRIHYLTNGTLKMMERAAFVKLMTEELAVVTEVHFSDPLAAKASLGEQGGVGCRIKGAPATKTTHT